jgi:hypothetical protein
VRQAAELKANHAIAYADAFAVATALEFQATLLTGDPEIKPLEGDHIERPTSGLHLQRVTLSLRQLGAEPHTKEVGRAKSTTIIAFDIRTCTSFRAG